MGYYNYILDGWLYVGGVVDKKWSKQVLSCEVDALVWSEVKQTHLRIWKHVDELPYHLSGPVAGIRCQVNQLQVLPRDHRGSVIQQRKQLLGGHWQHENQTIILLCSTSLQR